MLSVGPHWGVEGAGLPDVAGDYARTGQETAGLQDEALVLDAAGHASASNRIIVRFADGVELGSVEKLVESLGGQVVTKLPIIHGAVIKVGQAGSAKELDSVLSRWNADSSIRYAEPDYRLRTTAILPNDPLFAELWGMNNTGQTGGTPDADIDASETWALSTGSSDVVIASIDTGVDYNHEDLAANIWVNTVEANGAPGVDDDGNGYVDDLHGINAITGSGDPMDDHGHGTHTSGTMDAIGDNGIGVAGVNWSAKVMALKFLGPEGGTTGDAIEAINYMVDMKVNHGVNIVASNNSWGGGGYEQALYDAIQASNNAGIVFVASAGNGGLDGVGDDNDTLPSYPASYDLPGIISVAATDHADQRAGFSNYGRTSVDLGAPGVNITSTVPGNGYQGGWSGTSMAAPHVTGAAAMLIGLDPTLTVAEVKNLILNNVDPITALNGITVTGGRLNLEKAVRAMGLRVTGSSPAQDAMVSAPVADFVIDLSDPYDPATVDAGDLTVNGIAADSVAQTDADTLTFHFNTSPVVNEGRQQMAMAQGALARQSDASSLAAWSASFWYDRVPMQVVSTDPPDGSTVTLPFTTLTVNLNEAVAQASVGADDLVLSQGRVVGAVAAGSSVQYTLADITSEPALTVSIAAGALTDAFGNPSPSYSGSFVLDFGTVAYPVPLESKNPAGSLIYDPSASGTIGTVGDTDSFTIDLDGGQTISVVVDPDADLQPAVEIRGPSNALIGQASAAAPGEDAVLQTIAVTIAGRYTVTVAGANGATGAYSAQVILNAAVERESHNGPANDNIATAQDLETSLIAVGGSAQRGAVLGELSLDGDVFYSESMDTDPGWTFEGQWAWGTPEGGSDPASGHTGSNVIGYNLTGEYSDNMPTTDYAATPAISTVGYHGVTLSFWRWLGVESGLFDHANIQISTDGVNWDTVWENASRTIDDGQWVPQSVDISQWADNQPQVYLRWGMGPTDESVTYSGWNLDDVQLSGHAVPAEVFFAADMETDPGWTLEGEWAWGTPQGGSDPTSGFTGANVIGYNLAGDYPNDMPMTYYATTPAISTLGRYGVNLSFWRWLGVERDRYDHAVIQVSTDGENWNTAWKNAEDTINDGGWVRQSYDISQWADNQRSVRIRWGMGPTDASLTYGGWNLDDVQLSGYPAPTDFYSFHLDAGQSATIALASEARGQIQLYSPDALESLGAPTTGLASVINNFVAPTQGTYYVAVVGTMPQYSLVLTKNADFDTEPNNGLAETQDITGVGAALGSTGFSGLQFYGNRRSFDAAFPGLPVEDFEEGIVDPNRVAIFPGPVQNGVASAGFDADDVLPGIAIQDANPGHASDEMALLGAGFIGNPDKCIGPAWFAENTEIVFTQDVNAVGMDVFASNATTVLVTVYGPGDVVLGTTSVDTSAAGAFFGMSSRVSIARLVLATPEGELIDNVAFGLVTADDYYHTSAVAGDTLDIATFTPADGPNQFDNRLDPAVQLYGPNGAMVASNDNGAPDGRNSLLHYTVPAGAGGAYVVRVLAAAASGEYTLRINGATGERPAFLVAATDPAGAVPSSVLSEYSVTFNDLVSLTTLQPEDLTIDGTLHPTGLLLVDGKTVVFTGMPAGLAGGPHSVTIQAGAVRDVQNTPIGAFSSTIYLGWVVNLPLKNDGYNLLLRRNGADLELVDKSNTKQKLWTAPAQTVYNLTVRAQEDKADTLTVDYAKGPFVIAHGVNFEAQGGISADTLAIKGASKGMPARDTVEIAAGQVTFNGTPYGTLGVETVRVDTGKGDDTVVVKGLAANVTLIDSAGTDVLDFSQSVLAVSLNLALDSGQKIFAAPNDTNTLTLKGSFENVIGTFRADQIRGNSSANKIWGGGGNDTIYGSSGNDTIYGGPGDDWLYGDAGNDKLFGESGNNVLLGGAGNDVLDTTAGANPAGRNLLIGGLGADTLQGGSGEEILIGGTTKYDSNAAALAAVMGEWASDKPFADRCATLDAGFVDPISLEFIQLKKKAKNNPTGTVLDDGVRDKLFGGEGDDWLLNFAKDQAS